MTEGGQGASHWEDERKDEGEAKEQWGQNLQKCQEEEGCSFVFVCKRKTLKTLWISFCMIHFFCFFGLVGNCFIYHSHPFLVHMYIKPQAEDLFIYIACFVQPTETRMSIQ